MKTKLLYSIYLVSCICLISMVLTSFAYAEETKKLKWTTKWGDPKVALLEPNHVPGHVIVQWEREDTIISDDPDWNDSKWVVYEHADEIAGSGSVKGYATQTFKNGDKAYVRIDAAYTGTYKDNGAWVGTAQGVIMYTGGTGKYKNISGGASFNCKGVDSYLSKEKEDTGGCMNEGEIRY